MDKRQERWPYAILLVVTVLGLQLYALPTALWGILLSFSGSGMYLLFF